MDCSLEPVAPPRPLSGSRQPATATGAICFGPQLPDGSGRVGELGTDKPEVESSRGLGAAVRVDVASSFAPLRSAVFVS